ncbi:MAG TPA: hypothetical protein VFQ53_05545 [Kofleriaceae bacterium]|nr:hypothetical protein [Kofleriaceae bacterium]
MGCVIPPSLSVDNEDAGVNSPPAITAVRADDSELPEPGPVLFERGVGTMSIELVDTDLNDTLTVGIFVDYNFPDENPARATCTAKPSGKPQRTVTCDLIGLCQRADIGQTRNMTVVVFDREVKDSGSPAFQAMDPPGMKTSKFYFLQCKEPA